MSCPQNLFAPGAGILPRKLAGRDSILQRVQLALARAMQGRLSEPFFVLGLRGAGKTVLLAKIRDEAVQAGHASFLVDARKGRNLESLLVPGLSEIILSLDKNSNAAEAVSPAMNSLAAFCSIRRSRIDGVDRFMAAPIERGSTDSGVLEDDLADLLEAIGVEAKQKRFAAALLFDEMHLLDTRDLRALFVALLRIQRRGLPVVILGAGMPKLRILAEKTKTNAEKLFDYLEIGSLDLANAMLALTEPIENEGLSIDEDATVEIFTRTEGYPNSTQAWGHFAWNGAANSRIVKSNILSVRHEVELCLDDTFFRIRFDWLTDRKEIYQFAMSEMGAGPHRSGDTAAKLNRATTSVSSLRDMIIQKNAIYCPRRGDTAFTTPMFDSFLRRFQPITP